MVRDDFPHHYVIMYHEQITLSSSFSSASCHLPVNPYDINHLHNLLANAIEEPLICLT